MMSVPLRNLIADLGLDALADPGSTQSLLALAAFARVADARGEAQMPPQWAALLAEADDVFAVCGGRVRLRGGMRGDLAALRASMARWRRALAENQCGPAPFDRRGEPRLPARDSPAPDAGRVRWTLCAAALLFNRGLYFEAHEVIEPCWLRARTDLKEFLKGLIQVAVGLHHHRNGNLRGAKSLLIEGADRLKRFRPYYRGVELADFCRRVDDFAGCLAAGVSRPGDDPPRLEISGGPASH